MICHYEVLGVSRTASDDEIKRAYRRLALQYHPDKNGGDDTMFKRISEAYQILSDPAKRAEYDGTQTKTNDVFMKLFNIFLRSFTSQTGSRGAEEKAAPPPPPKETRVPIYVSLGDLYFGRLKKVVVRVRFGGEWVTKPLLISLLNYKLHYVFLGDGDDGGDLVLLLNILPDREGIGIDQIVSAYDLYLERDISLYEFYYGCEFEFQHVSGEVLHVKKTFEDHSMNMVLKQKGLPKYDGEMKRGDLYVFFRLVNKDHSLLPLEDPKFKQCLSKFI